MVISEEEYNKQHRERRFKEENYFELAYDKKGRLKEEYMVKKKKKKAKKKKSKAKKKKRK